MDICLPCLLQIWKVKAFQGAVDIGGGEMETCLQFAAFMQAVNLLWRVFSRGVSVEELTMNDSTLKAQLLCLRDLEIKGRKL